MGSGASKQAETPKTQTWTSDSPVRFSQPLLDSLQSSPESDSSRAKSLELHIQSRVASELKRLQEQATKDFEELSAKISAAEKEEPKKKESAGDELRAISREVVQRDLKGLKEKLHARKQVSEVDQAVEQAKGDVIRCLRDNDRRPLDCWKEVEKFKSEVRRLEGQWVEKIVR